MVICAGVGAANDHDHYIFVVDAVVVYWGFEEVGVVFEPGRVSRSAWGGEMEVEVRAAAYHFGRFRGLPSILTLRLGVLKDGVLTVAWLRTIGSPLHSSYKYLNDDFT